MILSLFDVFYKLDAHAEWRHTPVVGKTGVGVLLALSLAGATSAGGAASSPTLRVVATHPLRVAAAHFHARERVVLTLTGRTTARTSATADARGSFSATFHDISLGRCERAAVRAVGKDGSRGVLKVLPGPACISA